MSTPTKRYVLTISADLELYDEHPDRRLVRLLRVLHGFGLTLTKIEGQHPAKLGLLEANLSTGCPIPKKAIPPSPRENIRANRRGHIKGQDAAFRS
jgi:hypothetical protein